MSYSILFPDGEILDIDTLDGACKHLGRFLRDHGADSRVFSSLGKLSNEIARLTETLDAVIAHEWRDIGTLPKIDPNICRSNDLLGCWPNGSMMVVYLDVCNGWMDAEGGEACVTMPTHWQPLPEPPTTGLG